LSDLLGIRVQVAIKKNLKPCLSPYILREVVGLKRDYAVYLDDILDAMDKVERSFSNGQQPYPLWAVTPIANCIS
jgi:hypothetical protein